LRLARGPALADSAFCVAARLFRNSYSVPLAEIQPGSQTARLRRQLGGRREILDVRWGQTDVEGIGLVKDVKLWPGGGREWDWSETGTRHVPGILPNDVRELVDHGAEVVVLSRGTELRLQTSPETLDLLRRLSVEVHVAETKDAVELYNRLAESRAAGCLTHSTC
jgi:hypothetical protein